MQHSNITRSLAKGVLFQGTQSVSVIAEDDLIHITISPESHTENVLYFVLPADNAAKKYRIDVLFQSENARCRIFGLYYLSSNNTVEIKTHMQHMVPHCASEQVWRGVLDDQAKALFEGNIVVHPHAQKTDAQLSNKNLLLSKTAEINTKPILEIEADDVKCTHGATVGCLDEQALFYLRTRGIAEADARQLLIDAFMNEIKSRYEESGISVSG